jgi:translation initiation factor 1
MNQKYSSLIFSTDKNRPICVRCGQTSCVCEPEKPATTSQQTARISLDRKGRKGKAVTLIQGLSMNPSHMEELSKILKTGLGAGGTVKEGHIEIQGDHRSKIVELFHKLGYKTKLIGG